jgi:TM2 domain-containing membrane protein YozV
MYCPECGKQVVESARFCPECGGELILQGQEESITDIGTRDQGRRTALVYPSTPVKSPHLCWLNLLLAGLAQIIFGQTAKGLTIFGVTLASNLLFLGLGIVFNIAAIIDAYLVGKKLAAGKPVGKWEFFPST